MKLMQFDQQGATIFLDGDGPDLCAMLEEGVRSDPTISDVTEVEAQRICELAKAQVRSNPDYLLLAKSDLRALANILSAVQTTAPDDFAVPEETLDRLSEQAHEVFCAVFGIARS